MPKTVKGYDIARSGTTTINMDIHGKVIRVASVLENTSEVLRMWALVDRHAQPADRAFIAARNDQTVPDDVLYQGTATFSSGDEMIHVFELII